MAHRAAGVRLLRPDDHRVRRPSGRAAVATGPLLLGTEAELPRPNRTVCAAHQPVQHERRVCGGAQPQLRAGHHVFVAAAGLLGAGRRRHDRTLCEGHRFRAGRADVVGLVVVVGDNDCERPKAATTAATTPATAAGRRRRLYERKWR